MEAKTQVGANIKARRTQLGITQEEAAHRAGLHPVELGRAERGTRDLRISTLAKIARGLNIPPARLLDGIQ